LTKQTSARRPILDLESPIRAKDLAGKVKTPFLSKVGSGRTISEHGAKEVIFSQGDAADSIFYIHKGKIKLTVVSNAAKKP
jgi:CRP-like cAMP-binding protein